MKKLTISIEIGNEAMHTPHDVSVAVQKVGERISEGNREGYIRDLNGNTVGSWEIA